MCNVLILDDNPIHLSWITGVVDGCLSGVNLTRFPSALNGTSRYQISVPQRNDPVDEIAREAWSQAVLASADVTDGVSIDIAIVDLCLTDPPQLRDPEGVWICAALRRRFPDCFIILVSFKSMAEQPLISGGWFKYVPIPSVRIDEVVGLREDDMTSSRTQLANAIYKARSLQHA